MSRTAAVECLLFLSAALVAPAGRLKAVSPKVATAQVEFRSAVSHYQSGQFEAAAAELDDLARRMPPEFQVEELLGLVYSAERRDVEANLAFQRAVTLDPRSAVARANLAVSFARLRESGRAKAEFRRAVAIEPDNYEVNHDFGEFYIQHTKLAKAISYLAKAQEIRPSSYDNGYDLALAYEKTGQLKQAREQIQQLLQWRKSAELYNLLASVDEKSGDFIAAAAEYQQAAHVDPSEQNLFDWGSEFLLHHTWNAASEVFAEGVKRYPNSAPLTVGLGLSLYWHGDYQHAVKVLVRATDLAPDDPHTYYFLSSAYKRAPSEASDVIARFERFAKLSPKNPRAVYYYAMALWKGREMETSGPELGQVEALLKRAARLDPGFAKAHLRLGDLYSQERQYGKAVPEYRQALHLNPNLAEAYYLLGQAYVHTGQPALAQKELAIHQKLYSRQLAEDDRLRQETRTFVLAGRGGRAAAPSE